MILKKARHYRHIILFILFTGILAQTTSAMMHRGAQLLMHLAPAYIHNILAPLTARLSTVQMAIASQNLLCQQVSQKVAAPQEQAIAKTLPQWVLTIKGSLLVKEPLAHMACTSPTEQTVQNIIKTHLQDMHAASLTRNAAREERAAAKIVAQCVQNAHNVQYEFKMQQDPLFRAEQLNTFEYALNQLWATLNADPLTQKTALCTLNFITNLQGRLGQVYANTLHELNQLAFYANGTPKDLTHYNKKAPPIIAALAEYVYDKKDYVDKLTQAQQLGAQGLEKFLARAHHSTPSITAHFLCVAPKPSSIQQAICKSHYARDIVTIDSFCRAGNFDQAQAYINTQAHKVSQPSCRQIYVAFHRRFYNEFGIVRIYEHDPVWTSMAPDEKQACRRNPQLQKQINDILHMRALGKVELEKLFNIPAQRPVQVDIFLYDLIQNAGSQEEILRFLSRVHTDSILCPFFFNQQGIVKIWEKHIPVGLQLPINLNAPSNAELRMLTNLALLLEPTEQNRLHINQCIKYVHAATVAEGTARDFYTLCAKATFKALIDPQSNQVMLHCPDLTTCYSTPEQTAVHNFIAQRIEKALQLVDAQAIEQFFKDELYTLKQAYKYNFHPSSASAVHEQFSLFLNRLNANSTSLVNKELYDLFFNKAGILKTFEQKAAAFQAVLPKDLNHARNADLRFITHLLLATEPTEQNIPHIQQGFRYLCAAGPAPDNKRATYRYFAGAIQTALSNPASNQIILYAPDCSHTYNTAEQNALQDQIINQIYAGLQLVDKQQIADFIQKTIPTLQQLHNDNIRGHCNLTQNYITAAIAKNEASSASDSQTAHVNVTMQSPMPNPEDPQDPREQEDVDDDEYDETDKDYVHEDDFSQEKIALYAQALANVPGIDKAIEILQKYITNGGDSAHAKGVLFEIEVAYAEMKNNNVLGINQRVLGTSGKEEIDLVLKNVLIEAKNRSHWNNDAIQNFKNQIGRKIKTARDVNKKLEVHFKKPPPKSLLQWLNKNGIKFVRHYLKR